MNSNRQSALGYAFLMPAVLVITLCGVLPMAFVIYYSVHDTFGGNIFVWAGAAWFKQVLVSPEFHVALARSFGFSMLVLAIEVPLGIYVALRMPTKGVMAAVYIALMTVPLLTPSLIVGYLWAAMSLPKAGLLYELLAFLGLNLNMNNAIAAWLVLALMDSWHWTSLVVLLCFAGLRAIPDDY